MAELSVGDIEQLYYKTVVMFKGRPSFISGVSQDRDLTILDLDSQKKLLTKFKQEDIKPVLGRVGFVNHNGNSIYVQRLPVRRYQIGISSNNSRFNFIENLRYQPGLSRALDQVQKLSVASIANAINNKYPTFKEASSIAVNCKGSCAFDKQFAIDFAGRIYFKTKHVGQLPPRCSTVKRIQFNEGYEYLELLLEPHYEKTVRTFEAA